MANRKNNVTGKSIIKSSKFSEEKRISNTDQSITGQLVDEFGYAPPEKINRDQVRELYSRDLIVNRRISKELEDMFGKKPVVEAEDDTLKDEVERFLFREGEREPGLYDRLRQASKGSYLDGVALVYLNYGDDSLEQEPPQNIDTIPQIGVIYEENFAGVKLEKDLTNDNFNEIKHFKVNMDGQKIKIHPDRVIHVVFDAIKREPEGVSRISPEFDYHMLRKTIMEDASRAFHQNAAGIKLIELPDGISEEDVNYIHDNMNEFRGPGEMTVPEGTSVQHPAPQIADPNPYLNPLMEMGTGMPYTILTGVQAGEVTGSETNLRLYYQEVQNRRENYLDKWIMEKIEYLQDRGYFPDGDVSLDWGDITRIPEDVKSTIQFRRARAAQSMVEMGIIDNEEARDFLGFEGTSPGTPTESEDTSEDVCKSHTGSNVKDIEQRDELWDDLDDDEVDTLLRELNVPSEAQIVNKYEGELLEYLADLQDLWIEELENIKQGQESFGERVKRKLPWTDYSAEFTEIEEVISAVLQVTDLGRDQLRLIFEELHVESYMTGYNSVADLHGSPLIDEVTGYAEDFVENNAILRASYKTDDYNNAIRQSVVNSLREGDTIDDLERTIGDTLRGYEHNVETLARTETMYSINNGRISSYQDMGMERGAILAVGDERTCEECMELDGREFRLEELRDKIPIHPNCRCTVVASRDFAGVNL